MPATSAASCSRAATFQPVHSDLSERSPRTSASFLSSGMYSAPVSVFCSRLNESLCSSMCSFSADDGASCSTYRPMPPSPVTPYSPRRTPPITSKTTSTPDPWYAPSKSSGRFIGPDTERLRSNSVFAATISPSRIGAGVGSPRRDALTSRPQTVAHPGSARIRTVFGATICWSERTAAAGTRSSSVSGFVIS